MNDAVQFIIIFCSLILVLGAFKPAKDDSDFWVIMVLSLIISACGSYLWH